MLPFCGYHMGDYFGHWLEVGKNLSNPPKIFNVNWFRTDDEGNFMWPGFGDNMRVLEWILDRCNGKAEAVESPIGYLPKAEDINIDELDITVDTVKDLLNVDKGLWSAEVEDIQKFYDRFDRLPETLKTELEALSDRIEKM